MMTAEATRDALARFLWRRGRRQHGGALGGLGLARGALNQRRCGGDGELPCGSVKRREEEREEEQV